MQIDIVIRTLIYFFRFIQGSTNANDLVEKKVHIWDGNGSREFLDSLGFTDREVNDLGKVFFHLKISMSTFFTIFFTLFSKIYDFMIFRACLWLSMATFWR